jgi:hypothetical protein
MKNGRRHQKKVEDNLNFKAVLLSFLTTKTSKTNGFDTKEIDLVYYHYIQGVLLFQNVPVPIEIHGTNL